MSSNVSSGVGNASGSVLDIRTPPNESLLNAITLVIGIFSVLFNGLLLVVMTVNSRQIFASLGSYFIANLAIADFITGLNSIGFWIEGFHPFSPDVKNALLCVFWVTVQVSFYTIFVMSTERLVAIVFPFRAALLMSKKKTVFYCGLVWFVAVLCASLMYVNTTRLHFALTVVFEIVISIIVIEYVFVFRQLRALWQHSKKRVVYTDQKNGAACPPAKQTTDVQREYQVTVVVVTLAVILVVTVFPYMIATQILLACTEFSSSCAIDQATLHSFMWYYFPIELLNFALNPVVYAWRLPKYRKAFLLTFCLRKGQDGRRNCSSSGSPKTMRSICPNDKQIALLDC